MQSAKSYLEARGIRPETAQAHCLEVDAAPSAERITQRLGEDILIGGKPLSTHAQELLWFPYRNADGAVTSWTARIFAAPSNGPKFLTPKGGDGSPYIPPAVWAISDKADVPLILTEGPCKTLSCIQTGFPAVGLNGVYGACARNAEDNKISLHPLLSGFSWVKRPVHLAFDSDVVGKFQVRKALVRTFLLLAAQQAEVFTITSWDGSEAKGIDDFLAKSEDPATELELLIKDRAPFLSILEKTPADLRLVEEELRAVELPRLARAQIVRQIARAVGVPTKDLLAAVLGPTPGGDSTTQKESGPVHPIPEPWPEPLNYADVLDDVLKDFKNKRFAVITDEQAVVCALQTLSTYVTEHLDDWLHFLYITAGASRSGKTKLLRLFSYLCYHAKISGDPTSASIYYCLRDGVYTLLLDEVDKNEERKRAIFDLINFSTTRDTAWVSRVDAEAKKCVNFPTFCPKILAGNGVLRGTTDSRCIKIQMMKRPPGGPVIRIKKDDKTRFAEKRSKLMRIADEIGPEIADYDIDQLKLPEGLSDRGADNWLLLFLLAETVGGHWPALLEAAFKKLCPPGNDDDEIYDETELGAALIRDVAGIWLETPTQVFYATETLRLKLNTMTERPWPDLRQGRGLSAEKLTALLRGFGLRSQQHQISKARHKGYFLVNVAPVFYSEAPDIWKPPEDFWSADAAGPPPPDAGGSGDRSAEPPLDSHGPNPDSGAADLPKNEENKQTSSQKGVEPLHPGHQPADQVFERVGEVQGLFDGASPQESATNPCTFTTPSTSTTHLGECKGARVESPFARVNVNSDVFLGIDVETAAELEGRRRGRKVSRDALDPHKAELRILSAATPAGNVVVHDFRKGPLPDYLCAAIATCPLIAHGAGFDLAVLEANGIKTSRNVFCTLTASRLLTAGLRDSNDLGAVVKRHLGIELLKELGGADWGGMFLTDDQVKYCENDVRHLHVLRDALQNKLANPADENGDGAEGVDLVRVAALEMSLIPMVVDIRRRGIKVDRARLEQTLASYESRKKQLAAELRNELGAPKLNLSSSTQLLKVLQADGLEIEDTSKETLSASPHSVAGRILEYRKLAGLCTTMRSWRKNLDSDNRLYAPLNPLGAETGRFSCKDPNLLGVSREPEIRSCFIADDGCVFIESDYANIEMRIAAWFAQEKRMLEVFRNGGDIHGETAERVLGNRQARQPAKPINFGCLYGGGSERLRISARTNFGIEFTSELSKQYHDGFFSAWPNLRRWQGAARDLSSELTYGATVFGRRRWADPDDRADQRDWNRFQLATNFEVQGAGADALKLALSRLHKEFTGTPTRILLPLHDAILVQAPRENAQAVSEILSETMREAFHEILGSDFPVAVETNISERWGEKN